MDDAAKDAFDAQYRHLFTGDEAHVTGTQVPALLIRRARDFNEPLMGRRARFLMTSYSRDGEWLAHGWKDSLRIVSESVTPVDGIDEPAVWIQEERDFYGDCFTTNRFAVGISRVWIEQYVSTRQPVAVPSPHAWIDNLNRNPNAPELRSLQPAEGHPDPIGRRAVMVGETVETDLRAVGPVRMTDDGELALTVVAERDWYRWSVLDYPMAPHPTLTWVPAVGVWIE